MDRERWSRVEGLFHAAREMSPEARSRFLRSACDDEQVLNEVTRLLSHNRRADDFLEHPVWNAGSWLRRASAGDPTFATGEQLGDRFEVLRFLGHGGMGEVYEAFDRELSEKVALKTI